MSTIEGSLRIITNPGSPEVYYERRGIYPDYFCSGSAYGNFCGIDSGAGTQLLQ